MNTPYIECLTEGSWLPLFLVFLDLRVGWIDRLEIGDGVMG